MITVADARTALGAEATADRLLARMITEATAFLGRELNRYLGEPALRSEVRCGGNPPGHELVFADFDPVVTTEQPFAVYTRATQFEAWTTLAETEWALDGRTVTARGLFPPGRGTVKLVYYSGYAAGEGPGELKDLVRQLVTLRYHSQNAGVDATLSSETLGDYSYTRRDLEQFAGWSEVVARWRRRLA